ncbi:MAG: hypothetical protein JWN40_952 [Phycisphaerales bacterium]|jgi:hypothetical protein|nr:hypothetical protein [Phycisphaerales bacterium]
MTILAMEADIRVPGWFVWVVRGVLVAAIICAAVFAFRHLRRPR